MAKNKLSRAIVEEMFLTLSVFTKKDTFLGYVKLSITRDLFEDDDKYNEFYEILGVFHYLMMKGNETYTPTLLQDLENSFDMLATKFPNETDRLILETIYDARQASRVPNALSYITKKDVISTKFTSVAADTREEPIYTMGMLSSSTIHKYLDDGKLSKSEQYFCDIFFDTEKGIKMLEIMTPGDFARCIQDARMMPAVYFSISNILENTINREERLALLVQYLYGDIRNFNLDRFKLILFYKYFKEKNRVNEFTTDNIDLLEALRQECSVSIPSAPLALDERKFIIPDLTDISKFEINLVSAKTGRILSQKALSRKKTEPEIKPSQNVLSMSANQPDFSNLGLNNFTSNHKLNTSKAVESAIQDFPTFAVTTDEAYITKEMVLPEEEIISKRILLKEMDDLLFALKLDQIIKIYEASKGINNNIEEQRKNGYKYTSIKECLKGITLNAESLEVFSTRILENIRLKNLDYDSKELEEHFKSEKAKITRYLFKEKIFSLAVAIEFDFEAICFGIETGETVLTVEDLVRTRLSQNHKETLINAAINNENLLQVLLNSNSIIRDDIFSLNLNSYAEIVPLLFNRNILDIKDLVLLMKQDKITVSDIEGFDLENIHISDSEIVSRYSEIYQKILEYEAAAKANYEKAIAEGITDEDDIKESEEEKRLREELQELTYYKDVYITLFKKQRMSQLEEYHRRQDIYMEIIERSYADEDFEKSIASVTNMLYEDDFISMAQAQQFDDTLAISILKTGKAKRDDIEKFKSEIVSVEEIEKIRTEFAELAEGEELEEEIRKQVYILTYRKLSNLMEIIIADPNSSKEEKLSILYSIFYKNNITEKTHREFFESEILVKIYGKLKSKRKKPVINPNDELETQQEEVEQEEEEKDNNESSGKKYSSREFVYPTNIIWKFIELLDSDYKFRILADGYVLFESEKLNKVFIENVWQANKEGDFVRRGYGTTTLILDLDTFKMHQSDIIRRGRHGYKVDVLRAKSYLPRVQTAKGPKPTGMIIHEKDLKNTGKKIWFELILEHLGITQVNVNNGKTVYTQEDLEKINSFIMSSKTKYEEITK